MKTLSAPYSRVIQAAAPAVAAVLFSCARQQEPGQAGSGPRVVSLAPNLTEIVCAVGAGDRLTGRSSACNYPPEIVGRVPVLADFGVPSIESLIAARPDVVLESDLQDKADARRLADAGIRIEHVECGRLDDIPAAVEKIGAIVGCSEQASVLASSLKAELERRRSVTPPPGPRVFVEIWDDPLTTAGKASFLSEAIRLAGGVNIGDESAAAYYQVSPEWVIMKNPEIILCFHSSGAAADSVRKRPGWRGVAAVKTRMVRDDLNPDVLLRPGPRIIEGLRLLDEVVSEARNR
ncbi:MAG: cobalamin-binding protein [Lentisphaerae bacterium]|nr:cobalamin-binding protein [Lentisphaerota bacterium]